MAKNACPVSAYLVAQELVGKRPIVGVAAQGAEIAERDSSRARIDADASVYRLKTRRVTHRETSGVSVELQTQLQRRKTKHSNFKF